MIWTITAAIACAIAGFTFGVVYTTRTVKRLLKKQRVQDDVIATEIIERMNRKQKRATLAKAKKAAR